MTPPLPDPEGPAVLSARERQILAEIENDLIDGERAGSMRLSDQRSVPARRSQLLRLLWFGPALALVMIVGIAEPTLLPPLTVLLFMAVVLRSLAQRHGPR